MSRSRWTIAVAAVVIVAMRSKRGKRARKVYVEEVASGARPIQAVRTLIAAFVGLTPTTTP